MKAKFGVVQSLSRRQFLAAATQGALGLSLSQAVGLQPLLLHAADASAIPDPAHALHRSATAALQGFMSQQPDSTPRGHRVFFSTRLLPKQEFEHVQWDDGDGTARGLDAWWMLRAMTGDAQTGRDVEQGQWRYLQSLLHPETGLVFVGDHCGREPGKYYYHLWDQGRTMRYLVHRYRRLADTEEERAKISTLIERMIRGLRHLSTDRKLASGEVATSFERDAYWNDQPVPAIDLGPTNWQGWCIGCAQILEPQAMWARLTREERDLEWACQLAAGFMAGLERRRESQVPMFAENGAFYGHYHCVASGLVGMVKVGRLLYERQQLSRGRRYLELARRAYQWMVAGSNNLNRVCSCGYAPENSGSSLCGGSELCTTADVIELAATLAACAELEPDLAAWVDLWDDVERYTRNEVMRLQLFDPEATVRRVMGEGFSCTAAAQSVFRRFRGGWAASRTYPNDLVSLVAAKVPEGQPAQFSPNMEVGACCLYSGPRALYACWHGAAQHQDSETRIRIGIDYRDDHVIMTPLAQGRLLVECRSERSLAIRPPTRVDHASLAAEADGRKLSITWSSDQCWMRLPSVPAGTKVEIRWTPAEWTTREAVGPINQGQLPSQPVGQRPEFEFRYRDNVLMSLKPAGRYLTFA
jgi:hypothetical protein